MNRREAIKTAGAAVVSGVLANRAELMSADAPAGSQATGPFSVTFRGPSILYFDQSKNGGSAYLHFTDFTYDPECPMPGHVPKISIESAGTTCAHFGKPPDPKSSLRLAGLSLKPMMVDAFKPKDYDQAPAPTKGTPDKPTGNDWSSLKWIPRLNVPVSGKALADATSTGVSLETGELIAGAPHDSTAQKALWIWATLDEWAEAERNLSDALQSAATDVLKLKGRYEDGKAVIKVGSLLDPLTTFDLEFIPAHAGAPVDVLISAEPPPTNHAVQARPHMLYCAYYNVADPAVRLPARTLPYLSPIDFDKRTQPSGVIHSGYQPTPRPLCGSMRVIQ